LLNAGVADGNERELRGHKECVGQNEQGDSDKLEQRETVHLALENSILTSGQWLVISGQWSKGETEDA